MKQGAGSSMGATYDSQKGVLVLDHAVELTTRRGSDTVEIHAQHAVFERDDLACRLSGATADYRGGQATASEAKILFRADGSAVQPGRDERVHAGHRKRRTPGGAYRARWSLTSTTSRGTGIWRAGCGWTR